jgi:hypothetical protein
LCRPCIEHHIPAGRAAGLTELELAQAVEAAQATHRIATDLLFRRSRELLDGKAPADVAVAAPHTAHTSRPGELAALGASIGANCHPLLEQHVAGALRQGLTAGQVRSAIKMAQIVQQHAAEVTAAKAVPGKSDRPDQRQPIRRDPSRASRFG